MRRLTNVMRLKYVYAFAGILLFVITAATVYYFRNIRLYYEPALSLNQKEALYLHQQVDLGELTQKLDSLNWLNHRSEFQWAGKLLGWDRFKKGRYELPAQISYNSLFKKLGLGYQDAQQITILPGQDLENFLRRMGDRFAFDSTDIARVFEDSTYLEKDSLNRQQLFGRMLPETYQFYWTESPRSVINKIRNQFNRQVDVAHKQRLQEIRFTLSDIVTLASIIEWEAHKDEEKPIISGLYWNRLDRGMRLQADPTILYAIGERRRLYFKDYKIEHPYNTYIHSGLPPGPITNPSVSSIEAALYPADHDYLYMVATPKGTHLFSETFSEHKRKSRDWRKWIRKQYRLKRQQEAESEDSSRARN